MPTLGKGHVWAEPDRQQTRCTRCDACQGLLAQIEFLDDAALTAVHLGLMDPQLELEACALSQVLLATRPALVRLRDRAAREGGVTP